MQHSFEEVRQIAQELPDEQRILLANFLYESVVTDEPGGSEGDITAAWEDEITRRLDEIDSGAVKMIPLEEILAEMDALKRAKLGG